MAMNNLKNLLNLLPIIILLQQAITLSIRIFKAQFTKIT